MKKTNKAIAILLTLLMVLPTLLFTLTSCNNNNGGNQGGSNNGGSSSQKTAYSITVVTKGGMPMAKLPVYIFEYNDGEIGDIVDAGATDDNGKATFTLSKNGSYAAQINNSIHDGYDVEDYYPIVSNEMNITVSSSVIPESSLTGVKYNLGDVIRDFTVTTTTDDTFTLSEVLKEKKAVLINFWYTTCSWCVTEFPLMQDAYEKYSDDLAIIALDPYAEDSIEAIRDFQSQMGLTFDVAKDFTSLTSAFSVEGYPTSIVVDRYGVITMIEAGAITSERAFDVLFEHFTSDEYKQMLITNYADLVPKEKPNVEMPSSDEISAVFDKGTIEDIEYLPYPLDASDEEKEYSWPFVIGNVEVDGVTEQVLYTTNAEKESSYAQLLIDVPMKAGEALAFDYFSSTELGADVLYVIVDDKDIYSISGESTEWATCYAYVAEEDATYEIGLVYAKDSSDNVGEDIVYLKNLRILDATDIDSPAYIYRFAATNPDKYNVYQDYVEIFYNESDGYYHVDSVTGPLLLANLMGYTRFSEDDYVYNMAFGYDYEAAVTTYCNYASNSQINGVCPVNEELKELLIKVAADNYGDPANENEWLEFCCYYDSYGTDDELEDPIKGLALFSAYDAILSNKGATDFPNELTYNRVIMPRGLFTKFTPSQSGTYLVTSYAPDPQNDGSFLDTNAWIFTADGFEAHEAWYTYENTDRLNLGMTSDQSNCYMMAYLTAGKDYYINVAYSDLYAVGTIGFRIERLGGAGYYRLSLASPGYFTALENTSGELTKTVAGGIDVEIGSDGYWREKRTDGVAGSLLYADFSNITPIFTRQSIEQMIELGAFDFTRTEEDQYILNYLALNDNDAEKCDEYLRKMWGDSYAEYAEIYKVQDVYAGIYHGEGEDFTALAKSFAAKKLKVGDLNGDVKAGDARIGCVVVTDELAELLQVLMDKYTFEGVENSWIKLCYYSQYFCEATPH